MRESDEVDVYGVEDELDVHQDDDDIAAREHADGADQKERGAQGYVVRGGNGSHGSDSLFGHDDGADNRNQQQDGRNFERQQILGEQRGGDLLRVAAGVECSGRGDYGHLKGARAFADEVEDLDADDGDAEQGDPPLAVELAFFGGLVEIDQHDDEEEQHHDAADVEDDLYGEQELGLLQEIETGYADQRHDQADGAVHCVPARDGGDCATQNQGSEEVEEQRVHHWQTAILLNICTGWAWALPPASAGPRSSLRGCSWRAQNPASTPRHPPGMRLRRGRRTCSARGRR